MQIHNQIRYWLTSHNPHVGPALFDWDVYLPADELSEDEKPRAGDQIMIYEQQSGDVAGTGKRVAGGCGGIRAVAEVVGPWRTRTGPTKFGDESPCQKHDYDGFVPRADVNCVLRYAEDHNFHGFAGGLGLMEISEDQFQELYRFFKSNPRCC